MFAGFIKMQAQARYYKAQMHCHSTNSDGANTPQALAEKYKAEGYEIMMITDHNHLTLPLEVNVPGVLCIASEEITFDRHMNGFFLTKNIVPFSGFTCQQAIDSVKAQGGLIMLNHYCEGPVTEDSWAVSAQELLTFNNGPDMLEIWNTGTETIQTHDDKSIWDAVLTAGKKVWGCATDDYHPSVSDFIEFNKGWNMIWLDSLTEENVFNALINGNFYASTGVEISHYSVTDYGDHKIINIQSNADKIAFWGPNHQKITEFNSSNATFTLQNHQYIRAELTITGVLGMGNKYAWTQPEFLENNTSLTDFSPELNLRLYPNPAQAFVTIEFSIAYDSDVSIGLSDINGRKLMNVVKIFHPADSYRYNIPLNNFKNGIYLIHFSTKKHQKVLRLNITR